MSTPVGYISLLFPPIVAYADSRVLYASQASYQSARFWEEFPSPASEVLELVGGDGVLVDDFLDWPDFTGTEVNATPATNEFATRVEGSFEAPILKRKTDAESCAERNTKRAKRVQTSERCVWIC